MASVFETIKDRLPITEVLASYITVEHSGSGYKAKCPFHNEKTPSFSISPDRGLYYCFGCGAKGDIFTFVEQFEGLDTKGALKLLADRAGVSLGDFKGDTTNTDPLYEILERATLLYQQSFLDTPKAREYLISRGLTEETIIHFRIGYAPSEWRFIEEKLSLAQKKDALSAGILKQQESKLYDRFRSRIMFPLTDSSGRVIGFSGRLFSQTDEGPKYLNSPETPLFHKSKFLFGFDKAKLAIRKHNFAILVEGQMDLVLSHQYGFKNTVATSGTAVSEESLKDPFSNLAIISRLTPNILLAFDGDEAGQKAMDKAAVVALSLGMNPKVVRLPEGLDPADYLKEYGADAWKERLKESKHFIEHHLDRIRTMNLSPHVFVKTIKQVLFPFLARVRSPMEKTLYITKISQETGIDSETISRELSSLVFPKQEYAVVPTVQKKETTLYERLVALRMLYPDEKSESFAQVLDTLLIEDFIFRAPPLSDDEINRATHLVEKEYGQLSQEEKQRVVQDLVEGITLQFLKDARVHFSFLLRQAHGNEVEEARILSLLSEINTRTTTSRDM